MKKLLVLLAFLLLALPARADDAPAATTPATGPVTHLPLPRFAALRSGEANMRTGPGLRYPIEWVYRHRGLPVEITAEYDVWRRVRDPQGTEGWVNKTELTGTRALIVTGGPRELRDDNDAQAAIVAHLAQGAVGRLLSCKPDWCKADFGDDIRGWLPKTDFWGAYPDEKFD